MLRPIRTRLQKVWAALALLSVELVVILAVFFAALLLFAFLVRRVFIVHKIAFDQHAFDLLGQYVTPGTAEFMRSVTFLGTHFFLIPANLALVIWFLVVRRHRWYSIKIPAVATSSLLLMLGLKDVFARARPLEPLLGPAHGYSFPSGHALVSTTFYGLLAYIAWQRIRQPVLRYGVVIGLILLILLIGISRVYLRVHFASDVLAGFCLGFAWLVLSLGVLARMERWGHRNAVLPGPAPGEPEEAGEGV